MKEKLYKMPKEHRDLCRKFDKDFSLPKGTTQNYGEYVHYVQDDPDVEDCRTEEEIIKSLTRCCEGGPGWTREKERQLDELNRKLVEWEGDVLDRENDEIIEDFFTLNFFSP